MPDADAYGPQPVESREAYDAVADEFKNTGTAPTLPHVAYDQPGQVLTPEQLPDPQINIRAGFVPQDLSSVVVLPKDEALLHPAGPELTDPIRTHGAEVYRKVAEWAEKNREQHDEQRKLEGQSAPERESGESARSSSSSESKSGSSSSTSQSSARKS